MTPLYARVGKKLIESLKNSTLISNNLADRYFTVVPRTAELAIARALVYEEQRYAQTRWSDATSAGGTMKSWGGVRFGSRLVDSRTQTVPAGRSEAFTPIR